MLGKGIIQKGSNEKNDGNVVTRGEEEKCWRARSCVDDVVKRQCGMCIRENRFPRERCFPYEVVSRALTWPAAPLLSFKALNILGLKSSFR